MKSSRILLTSALLAALLTGCGSQEPSETETPGPAPDARSVFEDAIHDLEEQGLYPDGSTSADKGTDSFYTEDYYVDQYAILDVDNDGAEELILRHEDDCMAGMFTAIYSFDVETETLRTELVEWPGLYFYDHGLIRADASHNHTNGDSWPYVLYCYDKEQDLYVPESAAHSWKQALKPEGYPAEADTSGTGSVYFVNDAENMLDESNPMDEADYLAWEQGWQADAQELQLDWQEVQVPHLNPAEE